MPDSSAPITSAAATGNQSINGLLIGWKWMGAITYSAPNSLSDYEPGYFTGLGITSSFNTNNFSAFTPQQLAAFHFALNTSGPAAGFSVAGFTELDVTFIDGGSGDGTIRGANMADANPTAYGFYPHSSVYGGDTFFGNSYDLTVNSLKFPTPGNWAWHTMLHEIGHTLGLKHGHESGGGNGPLPANVDSLEFTVMTYRGFIGQSTSGYRYEQWGAPQTYMMLDIAALQHLYGADFTANDGDTVYKWAPNSGNTLIDGQIAISPGGNRIFATIWDGGGIDTYDLSAYSTGVSMDLRPGSGSVFSAAQLAYLGGGPNGGYARANIFNALQYNGDPRSLIENAIGGAGNDTIIGNQADNILTGNGGNDTLHGGDGNDTLEGGAGSDTASYAWTNAAVTVNLSLAGPQNTGGAGIDTLLSIENVYGGYGNDVLVGDGGNNMLRGDAGHDYLVGGAGNDTLDGGPGNDTLDGGTGNDHLIGGDGFDALHGGAGNDTLDGGTGNDYLAGGDGDDVLFGGDGDDVLDGGTGNNHLVGGAGNDVLYGGDGNDTLDGGIGNDYLVGSLGGDALYGGDGYDTLDGGFGFDVLNGGAGGDVLYGGDGNDYLYGGTGIDYLYGGSGADRFDFNSIKESTKSAGRDRIKDFSRKQGDKIDLRDIDANSKKGGNQKFKFIGDDKFSKTAGELRFDDKKVQADVNGDGKADFVIYMNISKLTSGDFFL